MDIARHIAPPDRRELTRLWGGLLIPPIAWLIDLQISYAIAGWVCETGRHWIIDVTTLITLLITLAAGALSLGTWRMIEPAADDADPRSGRTRLMAIGGMVNAAFFALVIVATAIPNFMLRSCP